ncbi:hypothetical protein V8C26DRAFT_385461 [Trichoderma gracile]
MTASFNLFLATFFLLINCILSSRSYKHPKAMALSFNLDKYECIPPPRLWHITHTDSQSKRELETQDLVAADSSRVILTRRRLKEAFKEQIDWGNRKPTCFVSVHSDRQHALVWPKSFAGSRGSRKFSWDIVEIDTAKLPAGTRVFDATVLSQKLGVRHDYSEHEYIFLHRIPHEAIVNPESLQNLGVVEKNQKPKEPDTSDMAVNDRTASPDKQTDLAREFVRLNISKSVLGRPTVVKMRTRKKPIAPVKDEPAIL